MQIIMGHLVTHHIVLLPPWKEWQIIQTGIGSIPGMDLVGFFCFCSYLQGLNQPIVSGLTKSLSISRGSYIIRVPTIQQRSYKTATVIVGSMGCIDAEITRSFTS